MNFSTQHDIRLSKLLKDKGIDTVCDLEIDHLAMVFNAMVIKGERNKCYYEDDFALIELNVNQSLRRMRKAFFHELAHIVSHYGDQRRMSQDFKTYQESQAKWFSLYLAMPKHIFEPLLLKHPCIETLQSLFELPHSMIVDRVGTIKRERKRYTHQMRFQRKELNLRKKSLQPGEINDSTLDILKQLEKQIGDEQLNEHTKSLLRGY
ncbi:hypothetical protein BTR22_19050 [Alkalihalophilus pseudofirmus]|uniref:ImmA/IrrE family metallo-endopeptidase n=1 Tax=Alkalihalophilus pseudofirmus TaxID=79885 RepID=UPI0009530EE2|nr:hypothetical protein BTR22_19050 [Alkalihalophilus pseudofirmus]